jgi:hypothetical protein
MADSSFCEDEGSTMRKRTLIVKLPGSFEDDLIILHCEVSSEDPMNQFEHIEVTGVLTIGHLSAKEAQERYSVLSNMVDNA